MAGKVLVIKGADFSSVAVEQVTIIDPSAPTYRLTVASANASMGTVTGGGMYTEGANVTISAVPASGYKFVRWNDGNTNATRTVTMGDSDVTYTATFAVNTDITAANFFKFKSGSLTRNVLVFAVDDKTSCNISVAEASTSTIKASLQVYGVSAEEFLQGATHDESNPVNFPNVTALRDAGWLSPGGTRTYDNSTLENYPDVNSFCFVVPVTYIDGNTGFPTFAEVSQYLTINFSNLRVMS